MRTVLAAVMDRVGIFLFLFGQQLVEDDAVGLVHLDFLCAHDEGLLLIINCEEGHRVRLMIEADQVFVVREQSGILGILSADRQAEDLFQMTVVLIE